MFRILGVQNQLVNGLAAQKLACQWKAPRPRNTNSLIPFTNPKIPSPQKRVPQVSILRSLRPGLT
jgi:hypothetical protein